MFTVLNNSGKNLTNRGYRNVLIGIFAIVMLLTIPQSAVSQPAIITCNPTPTPTPTETVVPYTISYGFRASDRNYGSPNGLSRQTGTLGFSVAVLEKTARLTHCKSKFQQGNGRDQRTRRKLRQHDCRRDIISGSASGKR